MRVQTISLCVACVLAVSGLASALTTYNDEATFLAAAGPLDMESFEGLTATNNISQANSFALPGFVVSHPGTPDMGVFNTTPGWGGHATDGSNYINYQSSGGETLTFNFTSAIDSFGINVTDWGDFGSGSLTFSNDAGDSATMALAPLGDDNEFFFGAISAFDFTVVELTNSIAGEAYSFDEVYYGQAGGDIPLPSTITLLALGLAGLAVRRRRA